MIGNVLGRRYEIISQLGGGGMAVVYKGRDTLLNRRVTIKVLRSEYTSDEEFVARFRKEAQAVAKLSHPNIVSVYDVGQEDDIHYIVMEYIEGKNLKEIIKEQGRLPVSRAVEIARQICEGLEDAHQNGIIHRDIKPHNILVTDAGRVKVTDFGIAQMMSSVTVTKSDTIMGSVHYFSPEQARGETAGAKSDIYSVGVVLYEMVTGRVPFEGETPVAVALKHLKSNPVPPGRLNPNVPADLERVIMRAMQRDMTLRYKTAGDMARDLGTLFNGDRSGDTRIMAADEFATQVMKGPLVDMEDEPMAVAEPGKRRKKKRIRPMVPILILTIIVGLMAGAAYYGVNSFINVPNETVPDVVGMPLEEAQRTLKANNLGWTPEMQFDPEVAINNVIRQDPEAHATVKRDATVTLYVSKGPEMTTVPNVVKKEEAYAQIALENAGFDVDRSEEYSKTEPAGTVTSQTPEGDSRAAKGSTVKIVVSKGAEPQFIPVPNLIGQTLQQAKDSLAAVKLKLSDDVQEQESTDYLAGVVVAQDPMPDNAQILEGEEIKITLSKGPGPQIRQARVNVDLPDDGHPHTVKIVVSDASGTKVDYGPAEYPSGETFSKSVSYLNQAKIQVYVDGTLVKEEQVP